jgi:flagellar protein FlgJ
MNSAVTLIEAPVAQTPPSSSRPQNVQEAAQQFEALLIGELLKSARSDQNGWLGTGEDSGDATASGLAEQQFAQALARSGGLGLGAQISASLAAGHK